MRVVEPGQKATFRFRFRNNLGNLVDVTTPTAQVIDFTGAVVGLTTGGFTNVGIGQFDFQLDTTDPDLSSTLGSYRLWAFGSLTGVRTFADAPELFELLELQNELDYVSVSEVITYLKLDPNATKLDVNFIKGLIRASTKYIEEKTQRVFYQKTTVEDYIFDNQKVLLLNNYPVISITSIAVEGAVVAAADFKSILRIGKVEFDSAVSGDIVITYVHGSTAVPETIALAANKFVGAFFNMRSREGISSESILGYSYRMLPEDVLVNINDLLAIHTITRIL